MLTYDDDKHEYRYAGAVVEHVTGALAGLTSYEAIGPERLRIACDKGRAVHKMVELHCKGDLDEDRLPEWLKPVLEEWLRFCSETGFSVVASEERVYHAKYKYAGTLDLRGTMNGQTGVGVVDLKRSFLAGKAIGFQTAAYAEAAGGCKWRGALKLNENGRYRFEPHTNKNDFQDFLTCLAYRRLQQRLL